MAAKTTFMFLMACMAIPSLSNTVLPFWNEEFSTDFNASGWSVEDQSASAVLWEYCNNFNECPPLSFSQMNIFPERRFKSFSMENGFAYLAPFETAAGVSHSSRLTSPVLDFTDKEKVFLTFKTYIVAAGSNPETDAVVEVRVGGSGPWTSFTVFHDLHESKVERDVDMHLNSFNGQDICLDISALAALQNEVQIRWRWDWSGIEEFFWLIDDVSLLDQNPLNENAIWGMNPGEGDFAGGLNNWTVPQQIGCLWVGAADALIDYPDAGTLADSYGCSCTVSDGVARVNATGCPGTFTELVSPAIDLSATQPGKNIGLRFHQSGATGNPIFDDLPVTSLMISTNGGQSYMDTVFLNLTEPFSKPFCKTETVLLPEEVIGEQNVKIKFVFAGNAFYWIIDDVRVVEMNDYDLKMSEEYFSVAPNSRTPVSMLTPIDFGIEIQNTGNLPQDFVTATVEVLRDDDQALVYTDTLVIGAVEAREIITDLAFENSFLPPPEERAYSVVYRVFGNGEEEALADNERRFQFRIGGNTYSKQRGTDAITGGFAPENVVRYEVGNCFFVPPGAGQKATSISFAMANARKVAVDNNNFFLLKLYKWKTGSSYADANGNGRADAEEYEEVGLASYSLDDESISLKDEIRVDISNNGQVVVLEDSTYYIAAVQYFQPAIDPANGLEVPFFVSASEEVNYGSMFHHSVENGRPRYVSMLRLGNDNYFEANSWGLLRIPFVQLNVDMATPAEEAVDGETAFSIYPNPTSSELIVDLEGPISKNGTWEVSDIWGRPVMAGKTEKEFVRQLPLDITTLNDGLYNLRLFFGKKMFSKQFVVHHGNK